MQISRTNSVFTTFYLQYHEFRLIADQSVLLLHQLEPLLHQLRIILLAHTWRKHRAEVRIKVATRCQRRHTDKGRGRHGDSQARMSLPRNDGVEVGTQHQRARAGHTWWWHAEGRRVNGLMYVCTLVRSTDGKQPTFTHTQTYKYPLLPCWVCVTQFGLCATCNGNLLSVLNKSQRVKRSGKIQRTIHFTLFPNHFHL